MWIYRYTYCLIQQHAYVDITTSDRPYQYCLRCGKVKEPLAYLKKQECCPVPVSTHKLLLLSKHILRNYL